MTTPLADTHVAQPTGDTLRTARRMLALGVAYYLTARLGLQFATVGDLISPMWPPSGVAVATLCWGGVGLWPAVLVADLAAHLQADVSLWPALGAALGATLEACIAASIARRVAPRLMESGQPYEFFAFLLAAALPAVVLGGGTVATALVLAREVPTPAWPAAIGTRMMGDWMGVAIVAPLVLMWFARKPAMADERWREAGLVLALLLGVGALGFGPNIHSAAGGLSIRWALYPLIAWATMRFGLLGSSASVFVVSAIATWATARGFGPFGADDPIPASWRLAGFLAVTAATAHSIGFLVALGERRMRSVEDGLARAEGVIRSARDAIVMLDDHARVLLFNPAAERLFLWRAEAMLGHSVDVLIAAEGRDALHHELAPSAVRGELPRVLFPTSGFWALRRDGTQFPAEVAIARFEAGGSHYTTLTVRNREER